MQKVYPAIQIDKFIVFWKKELNKLGFALPMHC